MHLNKTVMALVAAAVVAAPALADSTISAPKLPKSETQLQEWLSGISPVAALELKTATMKAVDAPLGTKLPWSGGLPPSPRGALTVSARDGTCSTINQAWGKDNNWSFKACKRADGGIDIKD